MRLKRINLDLASELNSSKAQNEIFEKIISEYKTENNKIINFLKERILCLEEDNNKLRNNFDNNKLEEDRTRTTSLMSVSRNEIDLSNINESSDQIKTLRDEICKLTRRNSILLEKCEKQSVDSEELMNFID